MQEKPIEVVQKYVDGVNWPASKDEVIEAVERNGAPDDVVEAIRSIDKDRLAGPNDVHNVLWKEV